MSDIMKNGVFDWDVFKNPRNKIAVHLKTQEECDEFFKMLDEHGMIRDIGDIFLKENMWHICKEKTCYTNYRAFGSLDYCKENHYHILEFSDYFKKETKQEGENKMNSITVNMENLTAEEREQLLALVKKSNESKVWKPKKNEEYYFINAVGGIDWDCLEKNNRIDDDRYNIGNCFRTKREAQFTVEKLKVIAELKRFAQEHNECKNNWNNYKQVKYFMFYDYNAKTIYINGASWSKYSTIYFTSLEAANQAIETIGADRLKKYYFEVED